MEDLEVSHHDILERIGRQYSTSALYGHLRRKSASVCSEAESKRSKAGDDNVGGGEGKKMGDRINFPALVFGLRVALVSLFHVVVIFYQLVTTSSNLNAFFLFFPMFLFRQTAGSTLRNYMSTVMGIFTAGVIVLGVYFAVGQFTVWGGLVLNAFFGYFLALSRDTWQVRFSMVCICFFVSSWFTWQLEYTTEGYKQSPLGFNDPGTTLLLPLVVAELLCMALLSMAICVCASFLILGPHTANEEARVSIAECVMVIEALVNGTIRIMIDENEHRHHSEDSHNEYLEKQFTSMIGRLTTTTEAWRAEIWAGNGSRLKAAERILFRLRYIKLQLGGIRQPLLVENRDENKKRFDVSTSNAHGSGGMNENFEKSKPKITMKPQKDSSNQGSNQKQKGEEGQEERDYSVIDQAYLRLEEEIRYLLSIQVAKLHGVHSMLPEKAGVMEAILHSIGQNLYDSAGANDGIRCFALLNFVNIVLEIEALVKDVDIVCIQRGSMMTFFQWVRATCRNFCKLLVECAVGGYKYLKREFANDHTIFYMARMIPESRYALRMNICLFIVYTVTYFLRSDASYHVLWVALTVALVLVPYVGSTLRRGTERVCGTFVGAAFSLGVVYGFPSTFAYSATYTVLFIWIVVYVVYEYDIEYGATVCGFTFFIIAIPAMLTASSNIETAALRALNVLIGSALCMIGSVVLFPHSAIRRSHRMVMQNTPDISRGVFTLLQQRCNVALVDISQRLRSLSIDVKYPLPASRMLNNRNESADQDILRTIERLFCEQHEYASLLTSTSAYEAKVYPKRFSSEYKLLLLCIGALREMTICLLGIEVSTRVCYSIETSVLIFKPLDKQLIEIAESFQHVLDHVCQCLDERSRSSSNSSSSLTLLNEIPSTYMPAVKAKIDILYEDALKIMSESEQNTSTQRVAVLGMCFALQNLFETIDSFLSEFTLMAKQQAQSTK